MKWVASTLKADSNIACRAHVVPLPCRASKSLEFVFPFDLHSSAVSDSHLPCHAHAAPMPCSDHDVLLKATAQNSRRETACGVLAPVRPLPATTRSSRKCYCCEKHTNPAHNDPYLRQYRVVVTHYKKFVLLD